MISCGFLTAWETRIVLIMTRLRKTVYSPEVLPHHDLLARVSCAGRLAVQRGAGGRFWRKAAAKTAILAETPDALRAARAPVADFPARRPTYRTTLLQIYLSYKDLAPSVAVAIFDGL